MQIKKQTAKFEIRDLLGIGISLVVLVIALAYGLEVLGDQKEEMCNYNYDDGDGSCNQCADVVHPVYNATTNLCYNATGQGAFTPTNQATAELNATTDGMTALAKIPNKLPMIVTVIIAAVIIGVLIRYLWVQYK